MRTSLMRYAFLLIILAGGPHARAADVAKQVLVPATAQEPRHSEAAIIPLKDGSLLLGWTEFYGGSGDDHGAARIAGKISKDSGKTWGDKYTLVENDGGCNVMEVNFLRLRNGSIALFHCRKETENTDCRIIFRTSGDEGRTFRDAKQLSPNGKYTGLTNGRSIRLKTGRILLEAWEGGTSYCVLSGDDGATWHDGSRIKPEKGECWEPACIELKDGRVMMLMRTGLGGQYASYSKDGGETWSVPVESALTGSAAPVALSRIPSTGSILAVWNHNPGSNSRNPLTCAISSDEGATWAHIRNLEEGGDDAWCYPAVTWAGKSALITYFNYRGGDSLLLSIVSEDWFIEK